MPGAAIVDIGPHLRPVRQETAGPASRNGELANSAVVRLQRQADAEFFHHVGFGFEIQIHLHGAGAEHHVQTIAADTRHVIAHDL